MSNDFGTVQRKGDHWTVVLSALAIIAIHCVGFTFPAYHASYTNWVFIAVNVFLLALYVYRAQILWVATFEDYEDSKTAGVVLSAVAIVLWVCVWGALVYQRQIN